MNEMLEGNEQVKKVDHELQNTIRQRTNNYVGRLGCSEYAEPPRKPPVQTPPTHIIHRHTKAVPSVSCIAETNHNITRLRPHAPEFLPTARQGDAAVSSGLPQVSPGITDFTKYIMEKDILLSRLTQFNDKPENYFMWKTSFKSIVKELGVTFTEELDLLCRWLGPESSRQQPASVQPIVMMRVLQ